MRICRICGLDKPASDFYRDATMRDGLRSACKECTKANMRRYRKLYPEVVADSQRCYATSPHGQEVRRRCAKGRHLTQRTKDYQSQWALTDKGQASRRRRSRRFEASPKGKIARSRVRAKRRSHMANVENNLTLAEWEDILEAYGHHCAYCGIGFTDQDPATQDHIIPIVRGGSHTKENIVPACRSCNSRKKDRIWPTSSLENRTSHQT